MPRQLPVNPGGAGNREARRGCKSAGASNPCQSVPLSGVDAAFLYLERKEIPLNIASVSLFDGPIPFDRLVAHIESKLPLIPRYRQIVVAPPWNLAYPVWEYDPHFDISRHILRVKLDPPGGEAELEALAGRILGQVMDRSKPLWDIHLVEGLNDGRGALIARVHHALADGISGAALLKVMLDPSPEGSPAPRIPPVRRPQALPPNRSLPETVSGAVHRILENLLVAEAGFLDLAQSLVSGSMDRGLQGLVSVLPEFAASVERLPFNRPCGGERKFCWTEFDFSDVQAIRASAGGTVNDVILSVLTLALARYVKLHKESVTNRFVRVVVPVNVRGDGRADALGNRISFLPVALPMDVRDPVRMLQAVALRMEIMKSARAADLVALLSSCLQATPAPVQALFWQAIPLLTLPVPLFNIICTNVPGSRVPLYVAGRRMLTSYPHVPTGYELGIGVAVQSYDGRLFFGLTADAQVASDVHRLRDLLRVAFEDLCRAAGVKRASPRAASAARAPRRRARPAAPAPPAAVQPPATPPAAPPESAAVPLAVGTPDAA